MALILWIPTRLPSLNDLLNSKGTVRGTWNRYNEQKCMWYGQIKLLCLAKQIGLQPPGFLTMLYQEPNTKRDPDNIVAGGTKLLLDSLVGAGVLAGDGWRDNLGYAGYWTLASKPGCLVHWGDRVLTKQEMLALLQKETDGTANNGRGVTDDEPGRALAAQAPRRRNARARGQLGGCS